MDIQYTYYYVKHEGVDFINSRESLCSHCILLTPERVHVLIMFINSRESTCSHCILLTPESTCSQCVLLTPERVLVLIMSYKRNNH